MPASSIGAYVFLTMQPEPIGAAQRLAVEARAGVAGVGVWRTGVAGTEFSVTTLVDVVDWSTAVALAHNYRSMTAGGPYAISYGGVAMPYNVVVLDVRATAERIVAGTGGLSGSSGATVKAEWKLIAV